MLHYRYKCIVIHLNVRYIYREFRLWEMSGVIIFLYFKNSEMYEAACGSTLYQVEDN